MEMISSTWSFEGSGSLLGSGIDAEVVERFAKVAEEPRPMPLVFTEREVAHARCVGEAPLLLAASFCCKEAVLKALGTPYNLTDCEWLFDGFERERPISFHGDLSGLRGVAIPGADLLQTGEIYVAAYLFV